MFYLFVCTDISFIAFIYLFKYIFIEEKIYNLVYSTVSVPTAKKVIDTWVYCVAPFPERPRVGCCF